VLPDQQLAELDHDALDADRLDAPPQGILRGAGMEGQTKLIRRRKQAIDVLNKHSYLLRSLVAPAQVYIDTEMAELPVPLDPRVVDAAKRSAIENILRVRPIYALQGPPGTGKTTLVAWLLREILKDDPVAQVLVTAQAHGAVDVLRERVTHAFHDVPVDQRPLAVRLGARRGPDGMEVPGSVEDVALEVLRASIGALDAQKTLSPVQQQWLAEARHMTQELVTRESLGSRVADFVETVKRGANLTYCTTSAGELEALAGDQSFDWSIVEEAGKAHGFDIALPLQAGHRWLLIGDQHQLPPYRYEDYLDGVQELDKVVEALQKLPDNASGLLDWEWANSWRDRDEQQRREFQEYAKDWLKTFKGVFDRTVAVVPQAELEPEDGGGAKARGGAAAGMLWEQHRMHPQIGDLISNAYYDKRLVNRTQDDAGRVLDRVRHPFTAPSGIDGVAIAWVDVPWCRTEPRTQEKGPPGSPRYTNDAEVVALRNFLGELGPDNGTAGDIAVLAPYTQQVGLLYKELAGRTRLPASLRFQVSPNARPNTARGNGFHTVDSFQGNQADVIAVSLVRNNELAQPKGLGFLDDPSRLNVLLSRAERLLVLVGSWDFFVDQVKFIELDDRNNPNWHWKRIVTDLEGWFARGEAVRLAANLAGLSPQGRPA
jgi:AAA domain